MLYASNLNEMPEKTDEILLGIFKGIEESL